MGILSMNPTSTCALLIELNQRRLHFPSGEKEVDENNESFTEFELQIVAFLYQSGALGFIV